MSSTIVCLPVTSDGMVSGGWGRASRVAVAEVDDHRVASWTVHEVRWDELHDEGTEGSHHARIARFLIDEKANIVAAGHAGPPMVQMLAKMGIEVVLGASGDARAAAVAAVTAAG